MSVMTPLGRLLDAVIAPLTALVSSVRRARTFHPEGRVYRAEVHPLAVEGSAAAIAARLQGPALVRMSSAWWRGGKEWRDVLGCAVRFRSEDRPTHVPSADDQDLLFATIRSPWTTLPASLTTHVHDFLANDYYAVSPFEVLGHGKVKWRLVSPGSARARGDREKKLEEAVRAGRAVFHLEARSLGLRQRWHPIAQLRLIEPVEIDQDALRFSPFRAGRGIEPRGFIHALRHATYGASQAFRPRSAAVR